jgi:hypothetical protein
VGERASLAPEAASQHAGFELVAGSEAEKLVAQRGNGTALHLLPDARCFALLPESLLVPALAPIYGRGPDAKLPEQVK